MVTHRFTLRSDVRVRSGLTAVQKPKFIMYLTWVLVATNQYVSAILVAQAHHKTSTMVAT
jgi:hypothetical protein